MTSHVLFSALPCQPNPCQNGGTCVEKGSGYQCNCKPDWTGDKCQTRELPERYNRNDL